MEFNVVERHETLVAGTVLRSPALAVEGPRRAKVEEAWKRNLSRNLPGPPATAYVDHAPEIGSYLTHIVGYRCESLADLESGDVLARIPAGVFARFTRSGDNLGDTIVSIWRAVWDLEASGVINRAYTGDFEHYPDMHTVEVFVALDPNSADGRDKA
ncbi:effector binding domain-containing protein [Nocardia otitidiscaviarum]|uniref:AraC family transcriptional regulator n=1 Tax=Nocardia otitidiscaviarum TaxID=1823 RepID=A0A378YC03_9NOCA|nr:MULTISPECIES: effector binding domain-containing protein [Nocardia]MBF6137268.1 effector binding domain-containing protein [Nocardia otitidiscaviarum]MBF6178585.1 effector binding domain-containing protein [Nocardia otitidiscaviarum]MBF6237774.1 effector binding domain-containing protein [Nocardia otitidiscaviarum]MBF6488164.1 effector binding domain-containing protein [Nocardia otitidiscaviarum]MCP9622146.1 GyrI-like domain-containing protein [Nocardia otitidiscaviarum]